MPALPSELELQAERARRSLRNFVQQAWQVVEPANGFVPGMHIDAICDHLQAAARGEIRRLLINLPPRHGKSLLSSVFFPAWLWANRPEVRFLYASYALPLAERDSVRTRRLIESDWYQQRFGAAFKLTADQNSKVRFENDHAGARLATSVGGAATGEGGDLIILDDPTKIDEASSQLTRRNVQDWFDQTLTTRLNNPLTGAIIVIAQRLHEDDLPGHLLRANGWTHLCLPAEYDPDHPYRWQHDTRQEPGQPLWPARYPSNELAALKRSLGSQAAAGQLQQLPAPAGGNIIKVGWFRFYEPSALPRVDTLVQSWDLTFTGGSDSDFVVGQLWAAAGADKFLIRQVRARMSFTETLAAIRELTAWTTQHFPQHRGHAILVEHAANGAAVIDTLRSSIPSVIPIAPRGNKRSRVEAISPMIEAGNVHLPGVAKEGGGYDRSRTADWVAELIQEVSRFPNGAHDDQVDAMAQALTRLTQQPPRLRALIAA